MHCLYLFFMLVSAKSSLLQRCIVKKGSFVHLLKAADCTQPVQCTLLVWMQVI